MFHLALVNYLFPDSQGKMNCFDYCFALVCSHFVIDFAVGLDSDFDSGQNYFERSVLGFAGYSLHSEIVAVGLDFAA